MSASTTDDALAQVASDPDSVERHFAAAARVAAREGRDGDAAREALLLALPGRAAEVVTRLTHLYAHGDAAERRAVLLALPALDAPDRSSPIADAALPIVRDALRTNDTRLVTAAVGPYAAAHLDDDAWRQAVLKVLFTGIPVENVAGLAERADGELARMVGDYAAEREAAGRVVPPDARTVLALARSQHPPVTRPARAD
ncbi:EboA domain-containing protein [Terrabacter sp. MAHUQ-38]|uniref:EboA domain-containing protein n=1 Tax=unclassified Terrabacter TaxID=2630222 RepID=UPI00165E94B2|nr:EboA domain-containing protein [Terrabacter sp. MAHUQ-38]MBC9820634.1 EboA domain-containing protein [Terrabacter sp. MAHUQ-38]